MKNTIIRIIAGILVIILGAVSAFYYIYLMYRLGLFGFSSLGLLLWLILIILSIVCSVFIYKAKYWVACLVMSVLFGGIIPVIFVILSRKAWGKDISLKNAVNIFLAILNIIAFILLAAFYYIIFIVQWGPSAEAIKWGLPVAVFSLFALSAAIFTLLRHNWKWGIAGICLAIIAIPYTNILLNSYSYVLLPRQTSNNNILSPEDEIMKQLIFRELRETPLVNYKDGDYFIVQPNTDTWEKVRNYLSLTSERKFQIGELSEKHNYDFTGLFNRLLELNREPIELQINSSIKDGYYIDYDNIFSRNDIEYSYDKRSWRTFYPQIPGYLSFSYPAYDPDTGYVMYFVRGSNGLDSAISGFYYIAISKYLDGKLTLIEQSLITIISPPTY